LFFSIVVTILFVVNVIIGDINASVGNPYEMPKHMALPLPWVLTCSYSL
jgi:hypothetical protein